MKTIAILLLLIGSLGSYAQKNRQVSIVILKNTDPNNDSISFIRTEKYFPVTYKSFIEPIKKNGNGHFEFTVPKDEKFSLITANYVFRVASRNWGIENQVTQPGDSIVIEMQNKSCKFSGRGHEKYELNYRLYLSYDKWYKFFTDSLIKNNSTRPSNSSLKDTTQYKKLPQMLLDDIKTEYSKLNYQLKIMEEYRNRIDPFIYELIKTDLICSIAADTQRFYEIRFLVFKPTDISDTIVLKVREECNKIFNEFLNNVFVSVPEDKRILSPNFSALIINCAQQVNSFKGDPVNWIEARFKGELKDRLLVQYFISSSKSNASDALISKISTSVKTEYCQDLLLNFTAALKPGSPAFNFTLTDMQGNKVTLDKFKGKTIVMDFWFTGCTGCLALAPHIKLVQDSVKNNKDIVFLSVSIDRDSERWKESAKSHKYSPNGAIELYTSGMGSDHPIIQNYKISAYPRLIIISREGKLISANPVKPTDKEKREKFISIITK